MEECRAAGGAGNDAGARVLRREVQHGQIRFVACQAPVAEEVAFPLDWVSGAVRDCFGADERRAHTGVCRASQGMSST